MANVVTMSGAPLLTHKDVLDRLQSRDDIKHVVIVVEREDGLSEVFYDRQIVTNIVFAAAVLNQAVTGFVQNSTIDD